MNDLLSNSYLAVAKDQSDQGIDPTKDYLSELVGEGKKFKDTAELARGKAESDLYIDTLIRGRDQLREDYMKLRDEYTQRAKLEDLINQLSSQKNQDGASDEHLNAKQPDNKPSFDPTQLDSLVSNKILEYENSKKQTENYRMVESKLQERYGESYKAILANQIRDLGISADRVNEMARKEPQLLIRALGLDQPVQTEGFQAPPRSTTRTDGFAPKVEKRTWSYYEKMRNEKPKEYWDPKTQVQMHRDHASLGKLFEDGNFSTF